jgi:hypothetical protein
MAKDKKLEFTITVVPTSGKSSKKKVKLSGDGVSVRSALEKAGIDSTNMEITVNGKRATLDTHITSDDVLKATAAQKSAVEVSERPKGS